MTVLRGITWDHPRGREPLEATARAFGATEGVEVRWEARSLQRFGDEPVEELAARYDLVVLDHPWVGHVAALRSFLDLEPLLEPHDLAELEANAVGATLRSYRFDGGLWALPIDAAAHVAAYRPDLLASMGAKPPRTWHEALELGCAARADGRWLGIPLLPVDALMCFMSLCVVYGEPPRARDGYLVGRTAGRAALALLRELRDVAHPGCAEENPIAVLDRMSRDDHIVYAPLLFGYSNYCRPGFRPRALAFAPSPSLDGQPLGGILGGAGLAVSAATGFPQDAVRYAAFVASGPVQCRDYLRAGGQPADRRAWTGRDAGRIAPGFFAPTLPALEHAYLRPRHEAYIAVQEPAGGAVHAHLFGGLDADAALAELDRLAGDPTTTSAG